jgi:hypothetical protein
MALLVATGRRRIAAGAIVLAGAAGYLAYLATHSTPLEAGAFLAEGVVASLVLFFCARQDCSPGLYYFWGLMPSLALIAVVARTPQLQDSFHKYIASSWQDQTALWGRWFQGKSPDMERIRHWTQLLFPAYWALVGLFRVWVVRNAARVLGGRRERTISPAKFVDLRLGDLFPWVFASGLLCEVFDSERIRLIGHNVLVFAGSLYLLQGFAVVQSFLAAYKVSVILIMFFYAMAFWMEIPLAFVAVIGFSDSWLEFRNRLGPKQAESE